MAEAEREQQHGNAIVHSDLREDSQNSLKMTSVSRNIEASQKTTNGNRGILKGNFNSFVTANVQKVLEVHV